MVKGHTDASSRRLYQEESKKLTEIYSQQEIFWRQRSKQLWLREGDQNNKFFHSATKARRKMNHISFLVNNAAAQNSDLLADIDSKEVKDGLFHMHPDKSPGPDGMSPDSNIALVPKKHNPTQMTKLRPISLCKVAYKIASKENEGGKGWMALKLDMSKAYDRVEWDFLEAMLMKLGFYLKLVNLFMQCFTSVKYSIYHGGKVFGSIIPERGIRQGDPLSSYLFLICMEGLSALIQHREQHKLLRGVQMARGSPILSHMLFADDSYIYYAATSDSTTQVLNVLDIYELASGRSEVDECIKYLGLPNVIGRNKSSALGYLTDRMQHRVESWDKRQLSKGGKEIMLKMEAQALPTYAMSIFLLPNKICKDMERIMNRYWWKSFARKEKAKIGPNPSFVWRSLLKTQALLKSGMACRVGPGTTISILNDPWLSSIENPYVQTSYDALIGKTVDSLINMNITQWDEDLVNDIFIRRDANLIMSIPIQRFQEDSWYWRGTLPTKDVLITRRINVCSLCPVYNITCETAAHVLVNCDFAKLCWEKAGFRRVIQTDSKFVEWFSKLIQEYNTKAMKSISMVCWSLWKNRNNIVWNEKSLEATEVVNSSILVFNQWKSAQDRSFDNSFGFITPSDGKEHWKLPQINMIMVNTDATLFEDSGHFSFSILARDHEGCMVEAKACCKQGSIAPELAEAIGVREALSWIKSKDWPQVIIETDCLVIVQAIRSSYASVSYFSRVIDECKQHLSDLRGRRVILNFVKRSANAVAHFLARSTSFLADPAAVGSAAAAVGFVAVVVV
ncbi:uncharacterized protein LOC141679584 [Apium graveolens]|uniref:uncharacterized protein LOC141679584 n=1 Tax=Apium graveolens TaxID=4045 RepID=UPI003D7BE5A0